MGDVIRLENAMVLESPVVSVQGSFHLCPVLRTGSLVIQSGGKTWSLEVNEIFTQMIMSLMSHLRPDDSSPTPPMVG